MLKPAWLKDPIATRLQRLHNTILKTAEPFIKTAHTLKDCFTKDSIVVFFSQLPVCTGLQPLCRISQSHVQSLQVSVESLLGHAPHGVASGRGRTHRTHLTHQVFPSIAPHQSWVQIPGGTFFRKIERALFDFLKTI